METWPIGATFPVALEVGPSLFTLTTNISQGPGLQDASLAEEKQSRISFPWN